MAALFVIAKLRKPSKCPSTDKWIKMRCVFVYTHIYVHIENEILLSHKKEKAYHFQHQ